MIVCNGYKCTLLENPFVFQIRFCPPEQHTQVDYYTGHQTTCLLHQIVKRFQGEVEIVLHNGNRIEVIKNTLSVIHEDEIIFNFDNRKISYVMVTNILPSKIVETYPTPTRKWTVQAGQFGRLQTWDGPF